VREVVGSSSEIWIPLTATPTPPTTVACLGTALNVVVRGIWYVDVDGTSVLANECREASAHVILYWGTLLLVTVIVEPLQLTDRVGSS
jgi:hypothetical protein